MKRPRSFADRAHDELVGGLVFTAAALVWLALRHDLVAGGFLAGAVIFLGDALLWLRRWKADAQ